MRPCVADLTQEGVVVAPHPDEAGAATVQDAVARHLVGREHEVVDASRAQPEGPSMAGDEVAEVVERSDREAHDIWVAGGSRVETSLKMRVTSCSPS